MDTPTTPQPATATIGSVPIVLPPPSKLVKALIAASKELKNPPKNKTAHVQSQKGSFKYDYSDLADVIDTVRPVLAKHGLAVMHLMDRMGDGWTLTARIWHESGEYVDSLYPVPKGIAGAQDLGGWLTYMRRYSTCNLLFISGETDDDASKVTEVEKEVADEESLAERRKQADKNLDKAKAEGRIKSAHDGKTLKPGEAALPEERKPDPDPDRNPDLEPAADGLAGIAEELAGRMRKDGITADKLMEVLGPKPKGSGLLPAGTTIQQIPEDMVKLLVTDTNWAKVVNKAKGAK